MASHRSPFDTISASERSRLLADIDRLRQQLRDRDRLADLAGSSRAIGRVRDLIAQVAPTPRTVALQGEAGVGKSRAARAIHLASPYAAGSLVTVTCKSMPDEVVDGQLGAPVAGSFEGGSGRGAIWRARGGTLFLDEVADLGPLGQRRLLHLSRDREWEAAGGARVSVEVRIVVSSQRLQDEIESGRFRRDLGDHLLAHTVMIPPLRERMTDVPVLADLFVEQAARDHVRGVRGTSARAMDMLMAYDWPGNVRQLRKTIERAVVLTTGPVIHHHHLPNEIQASGGALSTPLSGLREALDAYEKELLQDALRQAQGVRSRAARLLLTSERVFSYRLRKHRIDSRRFKAS